MESLQIELFDTFRQGGLVMWPLFALSLVALVVFVERLLFLHRHQIRSKEFLSGIENSLTKGRLIEALTICQDTPGPAAAMVKAGLMHFRESDAEIREVVREAAVVELGPVKRRIGALYAIAQVAPIFGVLGTVIGMIDSFMQYERQGVYVHAGQLASGGWQALVSTATGLALGAVAILAHHFLVGRIRSVAHEMEWLAQELMVMFARAKHRSEPVSLPTEKETEGDA
ncbi:MotA/TolQ/ExbB proton channel family protein [Pelagicoccus sp. SDUM812003]|uniref:MotA/TolQ/ExbB proton channel family protein n=1 Tax=Pelagicoccus sp. SDUM812003 TaxID=3041267 RepID=UPI00280EFF3E|nr:MotA/TolQ/ExbB proton channel family protein [Pelagicoccus sp. SDUM812003]MDQ8204873.1 MotA/TolQ/ExbB proton channel family protein [Pelagicoccus sp. SDUM812003]